MRKVSLIFVTLIATLSVSFAQNADDALRYSQQFYTGTARFMSMGGAFTALGGDISSLSQNPAGIGVFRSSEISITPQLFQIKSTAGFNGTNTSDHIYNFNMAQAGIVVNIIENDSESGLISLNMGYSFNKTNNLNQSIIIEGISNNSSLADYWTDLAEGVLRENLTDEAFLAWDTWIIDSLPGFEDSYGTIYSNYGDDPPSIYGQNTRRLVTYDGYIGEHAISAGINYSNNLFIGATLGISRLNYASKYEHLESTEAVLPSQFENFNYTYYYSNEGTGFGLKLGAIYRPLSILRLGFAFHSPTLYKINEYVYDNITSSFSDGGQYSSSNDPLRYSYALTTPFRVMAGAAIQLQKLALISADYEFIDYSTARFSDTGDDFSYDSRNAIIKSTLRAASNIRLGAELRFNRLYLRGGYS